MAKRKITKSEPKQRTLVRVKSTDLMRAVAAVNGAAVSGKPGHDDLVRAAILLTALVSGDKIKVVKTFDLESELAKFDGLALECDGMARVLSWKLQQMKIRHIVKQGQLLVDGQRVVPIHQWLELPDGLTIDYRARMWAGNTSEIPHGVFKASEYKKVQYIGQPIQINVDERIFKILTTPSPAIVPPAPAAPAGEVKTA